VVSADGSDVADKLEPVGAPPVLEVSYGLAGGTYSFHGPVAPVGGAMVGAVPGVM
jgi:hypothetical protein